MKVPISKRMFMLCGQLTWWDITQLGSGPVPAGLDIAIDLFLFFSFILSNLGPTLPPEGL